MHDILPYSISNGGPECFLVADWLGSLVSANLLGSGSDVLPDPAMKER